MHKNNNKKHTTHVKQPIKQNITILKNHKATYKHNNNTTTRVKQKNNTRTSQTNIKHVKIKIAHTKTT